MVTLRKNLINGLKTRLENYSWTVLESPSVFAGRTRFDPEEDPLPIITIIAGTEDGTEQTAYKTNFRTMPLEVTALISLEDSKEAFDIGESVFGELEKACFSGGPLIIGEDSYFFESRGGGIVDYPDQLGPAMLTITVSLELPYETEIGEPGI